MSIRIVLALAMLTLVGCASLPKIGEFLGSAGRLLGVSGGSGSSGVTTNFRDVDPRPTYLDGAKFDPAIYNSLTAAPRASSGALRLAPGLYADELRSYCLHAGTHGPSAGAGYLHAPLKGPSSALMKSILRKSSGHPEIVQSDIQMLIWMIEIGFKFDEMPPDAQRAARGLLSAGEMMQVKGGLMSHVPQEAIDKFSSSIPPDIANAIRSVQRIRDLVAAGQSTFSQIEALAVLPAKVRSSSDIPSTQWSRHPGGFFVRYTPRGYSNTYVEVFVPKRSVRAVYQGTSSALEVDESEGDAGIEFDPSDGVAVPAESGSQRLGMALPPRMPVNHKNISWKKVGQVRCMETFGEFAPRHYPLATINCPVEICVPYGNRDGSIASWRANAIVRQEVALAGQVTAESLSEGFPMPNVCDSFKATLRFGLNRPDSLPGTTVSSIGTTIRK